MRRINPNVAVGHDDDVMADARRHVDEVRDLPIDPVRFAVDDEIEIAAGEHPPKPLDRSDGTIVRLLHAEDDLNIAPIILDAERAEIIEQTRLVTVKRFENSHRRRSSGAVPTAMPRKAAHVYRDQQEICAADDGNCRRRDRRPEQGYPLARPIEDRGSIGTRAGDTGAPTGDAR